MLVIKRRVGTHISPDSSCPSKALALSNHSVMTTGGSLLCSGKWNASCSCLIGQVKN
uniref:Uncharacterized protein n=1 Tax=Anguilla anguilla TaxID=7936 RepID=A0A0E9TZJ4_ANGAN